MASDTQRRAMIDRSRGSGTEREPQFIDLCSGTFVNLYCFLRIVLPY
jgi:hypothetical protein